MIPTTVALVGVPVFQMSKPLAHCLSVKICLAPVCSLVMFGRTESQGQSVTRTLGWREGMYFGEQVGLRVG